MFLYTKRQSDNIKLALVERLESYFSELNVLFVGDSYVIFSLASSAFSRKTFINLIASSPTLSNSFCMAQKKICNV